MRAQEAIEQVLVVPSDLILPFLETPYGQVSEELMDVILKKHTFMDRPKAEVDPSFKQIIPYVLVQHFGRFMLLQRTKLQGEQRLHGKKSLGVGGHINPGPLGRFNNIVEASLHRELDEEIEFYCPFGLDSIGTIYDDSNDVGKVHVGLVYLLTAESEEFKPGEPDLMTVKWADLEELRAAFPEMENWSKILFERVVEKRLHDLSTEKFEKLVTDTGPTLERA